MTTATLPTRDQIPERHRWNAESVFPSLEAWRSELQACQQDIVAFAENQGRLADGPAALADALEAMQALVQRAGKVVVYASINYSVDLTDQEAAKIAGEARSLNAQVIAGISFVRPELLDLGERMLNEWMENEPRLSIYQHYLDDLLRRQDHVRSADVEEVLGLLADPFGGVSSAARVLMAADVQFAPALSSTGEQLPVSQGTLNKILASPDRQARQSAWEHYTDQYLSHKNTLATTLSTSVKQNVFHTRVRGFESSLEATLFEHNIPTEVFHNLISTFKANLPTWHRYWDIRRRALGVETLHPYDIWAPLSEGGPQIPFEQAVDWICEGMAPLGDEYVAAMRQGCLQDRWVDVCPNVGKTGGAFSSGRPGTFPFIVMSYSDTVFSMSTLAHELGHSMHKYLLDQVQPVIYSRYSLFVAEVASNFNQSMVRSFLLDTQTDPSFQLSVLEEAMSNFHRYFFIMPTLARFELDIHQRVERGQGLTASDMIELMADYFDEGYGGGMHVDRERVGITWATFSHLYVDYYVYQYATGISGANALVKSVLSGRASGVDDYLSFLRAGGSLYPLDALKLGGVDLSTPEAVEITFGVLSGLVDRLENLLVK